MGSIATPISGSGMNLFGVYYDPDGALLIKAVKGTVAGHQASQDEFTAFLNKKLPISAKGKKTSKKATAMLQEISKGQSLAHEALTRQLVSSNMESFVLNEKDLYHE